MGARHRDCDGGWVLEKEAGCKGSHCCVCEKSCPSGDEGAGWEKMQTTSDLDTGVSRATL